MFKRMFVIVVLVGMLLSLVACGGDATPTPAASAPEESGSDVATQPSNPVAEPEDPTPAEEAEGAVKAGMVTTVGGLGDLGFNDLAWAGLQQSEEELGAQVQVLEPSTPSEYVDNLSQLAQGDYLAFGVGYLFTDAITEVAMQYPDKHFAIIDSVVDADNVASLTFREEQGSYLAGVLAGEMTLIDTDYTDADTKVVGFLAAMEMPLLQKFEAGFVDGVHSVDPDIEVLVQYVGSTPDAFVNPTAGYEISISMIDKGADIIYHAAGSTGAGLFRAATERNIFAIGVDMDQAPLFPEAPILTSMVKRVDYATFQTVKAETEGNFQAGEVIFGIPEGGIDLAPYGQFDSLVPDEVKSSVDAARQSILDGEVEVPTVPGN